jgi:hypothetical protein
LKKLIAAAKKEKKPEYVDFAERLILYAQTEEEVLSSLARLMKEISVNRHKAFATRAEYIAGLEAAELVKLASLVRVVGLLMQVKAYLFWQK